MTSWRIETAADFDRSMRKLDRSIAARVIAYLEALLELEDPRQRGKALSANLSGYWRYRVGDYRILTEVHEAKLVVLALDVAHRSTAYRD